MVERSLPGFRAAMAEAAGGLTAARLIDFHSRYKYTLMAHSPQRYQELGRMLASAGKHDTQELGARYFTALMEALQQKATRGTNTNVLMHLQGYLKTRLRGGEGEGIREVIDQYRRGSVPLVVPVTLLRHYFRQHPDPYIERQAYLSALNRARYVMENFQGTPAVPRALEIMVEMYLRMGLNDLADSSLEVVIAFILAA